MWMLWRHAPRSLCSSWWYQVLGSGKRGRMGREMENEGWKKMWDRRKCERADERREGEEKGMSNRGRGVILLCCLQYFKIHVSPVMTLVDFIMNMQCHASTPIFMITRKSGQQEQNYMYLRSLTIENTRNFRNHLTYMYVLTLISNVKCYKCFIVRHTLFGHTIMFCRTPSMNCSSIPRLDMQTAFGIRNLSR